MTPSSSPPQPARALQDSREQHYAKRSKILAAQVRMLFGNADVGAGVTGIATAVLGALEWGVVRHPVILGWCIYMFLVSGARFILSRRYRRAAPSNIEANQWAARFAIGAGLAGAGWGAAGILL
ncbi:MAG TPA: hypothetical protein VGZ73_01050, partial [Bryobacteraceae bacterium]|nr:hypothetical protein [Bryobacteraceae bacterium]